MQGKNRGHYKKSALSAISCGLQRLFKLKREFNIISDPLFKQSNQVFEADVVELKRQGFTEVEHHEPILTEDLAKTYSSYDPSSPDPSLCSTSFGSAVCFTSFVEGERTVVFTRDSLFQSALTEQGENTSTNTGLRRNHRQNDDPFDSSLDGRMYENTENPALCPVRAFELYLSKLNPSLDLLWQRPKAFDNFQRS